MSEHQILWIPLLCSISLLLLMYRRRGIKDPLFWIASFYFYFAFGPVLNFIFGNKIYFGIVTSKIFAATISFFLAMLGIFVVSMLVDPRIGLREKAWVSNRLLLSALPLVFVTLILYGGYELALVIPKASGLSKIDRLSQAFRYHYQYLLLQVFALSTYFHIRTSRTIRGLYFLNFAVYVGYCLGYAERDFIFIILSLMLHKYLIDDVRFTFRRKLTMTMLPLFLGFVAVYIQISRGAGLRDSNNLVNFLNQGSLLFISTQIMDWMQNGLSYRYGATYVNSVLNLLPDALYDKDMSFYLSRWFTFMYAPGGRSQYGFSLDAEAFLNFGYFGVPVFFAIVASVQRWSFNRIGKHPFFLFFSISYFAALMYAIRNDSLALVSSAFSATIFFFSIYTLSLLINLKNMRRRGR